VIRI